MNTPEPSIRIPIDPTNPGQFFACCGLLELADKAWPNALAWFDNSHFSLAPAQLIPNANLSTLLETLCSAELKQVDEQDDTASPIRLGPTFNLTLDWWNDAHAGGNRLKIWAGRMSSVRIAKAMRAALKSPDITANNLLDHGTVVFDPDEPDRKVEPFYFDARRGNNAMSRDIGFKPDPLQMTTTAFPAVEFLSLVGLQRARPLPDPKHRRILDYCTWSLPSPPQLLPALITGLIPQAHPRRYRFENAFRTDQKKHKAFTTATLVPNI